MSLGKFPAISLLYLAVWWLLIPLSIFLGGDIWKWLLVGPVLLLLATSLTVALFASRDDPKIVLLWLPFLLGCVWFLASQSLGILQVLMLAGFAPYVAMAASHLLIAWCAVFLGLVACICSRPHRWDGKYVAISVMNCTALATALAVTSDITYQEKDRQIVTVRVLDRFDRPVPDARITYEVYGYGYSTGGRRPSRPAFRGRPTVTDAQGMALIRSKQIRHEVVMHIAKEGYLSMSAELGMQYYGGDSTRGISFRLEGNGVTVGSGSIPTKDPVAVTVYLPLNEDRPQPVIAMRRGTKISGKAISKRFFSFQSGTFVETAESADLRFDLFLEEGMRPNYPLQTRVTALRGSGVLLMTSHVTPENPAGSYSLSMKMAPTTGYKNELTDSGRDTIIYFKGADGLYARLSLEAYHMPPREEGEGQITSFFIINPHGPNLLYQPGLEIPTK